MPLQLTQVTQSVHRLHTRYEKCYLLEQGGRLTVLDRALESLDVLAATNAQTVLPGHGETWTDGIKGAVQIARGAPARTPAM